MPRLTETRAARAPLPSKQQRERTEWCSEVVNFGVRILHSGVRSFIVMPPAKVGSHLAASGSWLSRDRPTRPARATLPIIALNAARLGKDPKLAIGRAKMPKGATIGDLWAAYGKAGYPLLNAVGIKRASSIKTDQYRWSKHFERIAHEAAADFDTPRTQDGSTDRRARRALAGADHVERLVVGFGASRGLCERHTITIAARQSARFKIS